MNIQRAKESVCACACVRERFTHICLSQTFLSHTHKQGHRTISLSHTQRFLSHTRKQWHTTISLSFPQQFLSHTKDDSQTFLPLSLSINLSLSQTHTHTPGLRQQTAKQPWKKRDTQYSLSLSLSHTNKHSLSLKQTHTHTKTHTRTWPSATEGKAASSSGSQKAYAGPSRRSVDAAVTHDASPPYSYVYNMYTLYICM